MPGLVPGIIVSEPSNAELDVHDFGRHTEAGWNEARTEPTGHDQMPVIFDNVAVGKARAVFGRNEGRPDQRQPNLAAVSMAG